MWYLKSAFDTYQKLQTAIQGRLSDVQSAALSPLSMMRKFVQGAGAQEQPEDSELEQLRKRLAEVEARIKKPERPSKRRKATV
jgi:hypothetical protein